MDTEAVRRTLINAFAAAPRGTQTKVADALGVRPQTVNKWAKGLNLPEPETYARLIPLLRSLVLTGDNPVQGGPDVRFTDAEGNTVLVEAKHSLTISNPNDVDVVGLVVDLTKGMTELRAEVRALRVQIVLLLDAEIAAMSGTGPSSSEIAELLKLSQAGLVQLRNEIVHSRA